MVCLSELLAEATVKPGWTCERHSSSMSSSPYLSLIDEVSSTLYCNLDKDLPPLPSILSTPDLPAHERWSELGSFFLPELSTNKACVIEQFFNQRLSMTSPISPTRASSGVFARLTAV